MVTAIILAGGTGNRVGANIPKQFIKVAGKPIIAHTLDIFQANKNIDNIEIVCHKDWTNEVERIIKQYNYDKVKWITIGGSSFQESTKNGVMALKGKLTDDDIVVISFAVSPMTPQQDIDDSIRVCREHGNAIASADIDLCTCIKDDEQSSTQNIIRETLKGFANPWTFKFGELCSSYEKALELGILEQLEPHTTSLYFALGKRLWFSQCTAKNIKITYERDLEIFEGHLLLVEKRKMEKEKV